MGISDAFYAFFADRKVGVKKKGWAYAQP